MAPESTKHAVPPHKNQRTWLKLLRSEMTFMITIFVIAFIGRFIYLMQTAQTPYFTYPSGDAWILLNRALEILKGDFVGKDIYFYSSPPYPYFIALIFFLTKNSFFVLGLVQILLGSANCVLIFLLAKKLSGKKIAALIAGLLAALYGIFAFFDADLLMIFLTIIFVNLSLLFLIKFKETKRTAWTLLAGIGLGFAALDRTNILLFVPIGAWFVATEYSLKLKKWQWQPALLFIAGSLLVILPVTIRNYLVGHDFVLVSANSGVNFFIGNSPGAPGVFYLPPGSGLSDENLQGSATRIAEQETGRKLKPSQVSNFWTTKAIKFIVTEPMAEIGLLFKKFLLLWNFYEIPNHLNFYFIKSEFAPILNLMFVGFWLVAPLGLVAIIERWKKGLGGLDKLLIAFLITYTISLLPFFITERYRLPIVPILIIYAAILLSDVFYLIKKRAVKNLIVLGLLLIAAAIFVNWPRMQFKYSYDRTIIGIRYYVRAQRNPQAYYHDFNKAIIELKWALETEPFDPDVHFALGLTYGAIGYYSGAVNELETMLEINPARTGDVTFLERAREKYKNNGDFLTKQAIPKTPYEEAIFDQAHREYQSAMEIYKKVVEREPFHFLACRDLAMLLSEQGEDRKAIHVLNSGLRWMPDNFILLLSLADIYDKMGKTTEAEPIRRRGLEIAPNGRAIIEQLEMFRTKILQDSAEKTAP